MVSEYVLTVCTHIMTVVTVKIEVPTLNVSTFNHLSTVHVLSRSSWQQCKTNNMCIYSPLAAAGSVSSKEEGRMAVFFEVGHSCVQVRSLR